MIDALRTQKYDLIRLYGNRVNAGGDTFNDLSDRESDNNTSSDSDQENNPRNSQGNQENSSRNSQGNQGNISENNQENISRNTQDSSRVTQDDFNDYSEDLD